MTKPLPNYQNIEIHSIESDPRIFKILRNCTAKKVFISCPEFALRGYFNDFIAFLKDQKELVDLSFGEFIGPLVSLGIMIFASDVLRNVDFRLKRLELQTTELIPYGNLNTDEFFESFMESQKESLEVLKVDRMDDFEFTNYLKELPKLWNLSIGYGAIFSTTKLTLPNITSLEIEYQRMDLLYSTPNIRELKLNSGYGDDPQSDLIKWYLLFNCRKLEKLEVFDLPMDDFPIIPSLKKLTLDSMLHIDSEIFSRNRQLEDLTFIDCRELSRRKSKVLKIIVGYLNNLKSLTIISHYSIDPSAINYVKATCFKLKKFRIYQNFDREIVEIY